MRLERAGGGGQVAACGQGGHQGGGGLPSVVGAEQVVAGQVRYRPVGGGEQAGPHLCLGDGPHGAGRAGLTARRGDRLSEDGCGAVGVAAQRLGGGERGEPVRAGLVCVPDPVAARLLARGQGQLAGPRRASGVSRLGLPDRYLGELFHLAAGEQADRQGGRAGVVEFACPDQAVGEIDQGVVVDEAEQFGGAESVDREGAAQQGHHPVVAVQYVEHGLLGAHQVAEFLARVAGVAVVGEFPGVQQGTKDIDRIFDGRLAGVTYSCRRGSQATGTQRAKRGPQLKPPGPAGDGEGEASRVGDPAELDRVPQCLVKDPQRAEGIDLAGAGRLGGQGGLEFLRACEREVVIPLAVLPVTLEQRGELGEVRDAAVTPGRLLAAGLRAGLIRFARPAARRAVASLIHPCRRLRRPRPGRGGGPGRRGACTAPARFLRCPWPFP